MGFHRFGPLRPGSPLFQGRRSETDKLLDACRSETKAYHLVYGSRQSGKTSLLLHLSQILDIQKIVHPCRVNFQRLPDASAGEALGFLARQVFQEVPGLGGHSRPPECISPQEFDVWFRQLEFSGRIVLLLDELGALSDKTRIAIANVMRAMFNERFDSSLERVLVIIFAGSEIDNLVSAASPLQNVCARTRLPDLSPEETASLMHAGLQKESTQYPDWDLDSLAQMIYSHAAGQPFLTQWLGQLTSEYIAQEKLPPKVDNIDEMAAGMLKDDDDYFRRLFRHTTNHNLADAVHRMSKTGPDQEQDAEMRHLDLLGVAKWMDGKWQFRNPLIETALQGLLRPRTKEPKAKNEPGSKNRGSFAETEVQAALDVAETIKTRILAVGKLKQKVEKKERENPVRDYLALHPYLLDPEYVTFTVERNLSGFLDEMNAISKMPEGSQRKRVDLLLSSGNQLVLFEFMRPGLSIDWDHISRYEFYFRTIQKKLTANSGGTFHSFTGYVVADSIEVDNVIHDKIQSMRAFSMFAMDWNTLVYRAFRQYEEHFDALVKGNPDDARLKALAEFRK